MGALTGKTAVILGCSMAGGTGWAIAEALAAAGARVTVAARSEGPLRELAGKIDGHAVVCDAGQPEQIAELARSAQARFGKIDIAVNAAFLSIEATLDSATPEQIQSALDVNYIAHVHFVRETARRMNEGGSIILISSLSASQPVGEYFPYACAKAATDCLVRYAAIEYGRRGIRVNSILPGPIRNSTTEDWYAQPAIDHAFTSRIPLGRVGEPKDFADAVLWLAGPAFVTGLNIPICGGNQLTGLPSAHELADA